MLQIAQSRQCITHTRQLLQLATWRNIVHIVHTLYTFCIQNWYKFDTFLQIDTFSSGQEFSRVDPEYLQEGTRHEGMNGRVAQHLYNCGHEKLVEEPHRRSVWTVLPVNHILGKLLLAPANSIPWRTAKDDDTAHVWWTLPMAGNWGRDKLYKLYRWYGYKICMSE